MLTKEVNEILDLAFPVWYTKENYWRGEFLEVIFADRKMQRVCNDEDLLRKEYGNQNAKKIMLRLTELQVVDNLSEISSAPPPRRHQLKNNRKGQFAVDIKQPFRILFEPDNDPIPLLDDGGIDIKKVTKIKVIWIGDYHDE